VLNSASTLVTIDFYKKLLRPNATDQQQVRFGQLAGVTVLCASVVVAWYFSLTPKAPLLVKVQNVFFFIAPPFSVIFCAGLLWRRANATGALATIFSGFAFSLLFDYFVVGQKGVYLHRAFFTWCFCVLTIAVVSYFTKPPLAEKVEPILWNRAYARLPLEEKQRYRGIRDWRIWWGIFVGSILAIYAWFLWFRLQHPVKMLPW
jgi:SSS family solute:Na+ symporter